MENQLNNLQSTTSLPNSQPDNGLIKSLIDYLSSKISFNFLDWFKQHNHDGINSSIVSNSGSGVSSFKVGTGTSPASTGTQAITGVGFRPRLIIFKAWKGTASASYIDENLASHSYGHATSPSDDYCHVFSWRAGSILAWGNYQAAHLVQLYNEAGSAAIVGDLQSLDSDGFTLNWTKTDEQANFMWEAWA